MAAIAAEPRTVVLFESPHRVRATIGHLATACGGSREVAVARELTKLHEEVWRGDLGGAADWLASVEPRGEYVVILGPPPPAVSVAVDDERIAASVVARLAVGDDRKAAVAAVAADLGVPKRRVYDVAVGLKRGASGADG